jgi:uncharacterized protein (DUF2336 family)
MVGQAGEAERVRMAAGATATPAILLALATDPSVTVRAALALGRRTTPDLDDLLAADCDAPVRVLLARRLATALPLQTSSGHAELAARATATLERLVHDEAEQVRGAIATALVGWPDAPRALVLRLARDLATAISDPVIRLSQALTEADLLQLLAEATAGATPYAVARRPGLSAQVADAVVASGDAGAIGALLANATAAIREATLDALAARSAVTTEWQAPLAARPALPATAALLLSQIVTTEIMASLAARADLPPALLARLRADLDLRLHGSLAVACGPPSDADFAAALAAGERWRAMGLLAAAASVPFAVVDHTAERRNLKAVVSLVWKAGFTAASAIAAQMSIAHAAPGGALQATGDGGFPLTEREMEWQIELLAGVSSPAASLSKPPDC